MSDTTANLTLSFLATGQAQKHVRLNESLRRLDALVRMSVVSASNTAEPASLADGAVYIVPPGKSGAHWPGFADGSLGHYAMARVNRSRRAKAGSHGCVMSTS